MAKESRHQSLEAKHGEKMIEVRLRFWTNDISPEPGKIVPKHAWTGGVVTVEPNSPHGIVPGKSRPFNTLLEVGAVVEKVLIDHGIVLHLNRKMEKYISRSS